MTEAIDLAARRLDIVLVPVPGYFTSAQLRHVAGAAQARAAARELEIPVREQPIPREMLYVADEVFFCGTAAEVTPARSMDKIQIGDGRRGPITKKLQEKYLATVRGETADRHGWLTRVPQAVAAASR